MSQEAFTTATPAMDLQLSKVFGPEGTFYQTHVVRLTNEQYHDLTVGDSLMTNLASSKEHSESGVERLMLGAFRVKECDLVLAQVKERL
ncbi:MAG: hypothetical protein Q9194_003540 [Teloschistes cf. exilis]